MKKLIVGLGNPGREYEQTRHNVGFLVLDELLEELAPNTKFKNSKKLRAAVAQITDDLMLCKPHTFMNLSGKAVKNVYEKMKDPQAEIFVIHDEADLPFGEVRTKVGGSSAGHRGVQSILETFPEKDITRIRLGIGRPTSTTMELEKWVLSKWEGVEKDKKWDMIEKAIQFLQLKLIGTR